MFQKAKQLMSVVAGMIMLAAASYVSYLFLKQLGRYLLLFDKQVTASIVAATGTLFAALATVLYSQRRSKERDISEAHRPQKVELYKRFMEILMMVLRMSKADESENEAKALPNTELEEFFYGFTRDIIVWGSPGVIQAYKRFRTNDEQGTVLSLLLVDDLLRAIRQDLGNSNKGLKRGDLVKLFLRDPDEVDKMSENRKIISITTQK